MRVSNATYRWSAAKRFYIVKEINPFGSEPRKTGVEDLACILGDDTLSVIDSVEAAICRRLSWIEPCVGNSGREIFFSRRSVGRFLCLEGRKEEPDSNQYPMGNQVSGDIHKDSLAIDKPCDSALNQCSDSFLENLCEKLLVRESF